MLAVMLGGCVPSLHPLFTKADYVFEEKLLGTWSQEGSEDIWRLSRDEGNEQKYRLVNLDSEGRAGALTARLGKIDDVYYLDVFPEAYEDNKSGFYQFHLIRAHSFFRIDRMAPPLTVRMLHPDKIQKLAEKDPNCISYEDTDNGMLLTASTSELRQFIAEYPDPNMLFTDPVKLFRITTEDTNEPAQAENIKGISRR